MIGDRASYIWFTFFHRRVLTIWPESLLLSKNYIFYYILFSPWLSGPASAAAPAGLGAGEAGRRVSATRGRGGRARGGGVTQQGES